MARYRRGSRYRSRTRRGGRGKSRRIRKYSPSRGGIRL